MSENPMKTIPGKKKSQSKLTPIRKALLAKVHIAKKDLALDDDEYMGALNRVARTDHGIVTSAAALSEDELTDLVEYFKTIGFKPRKTPAAQAREKQAAALRRRAMVIAADLPGGEKRLAGLAKKICGVELITWCHDPKTLKGLVAALTKIQKQEAADDDA